MGESRQELLLWLNSLLQTNVTKVEQCGTGAALCQIFDSIFLDVPMSKVKFNVTSEYGYLQNFKILQSAFTRHSIDRTIPVESLVKCKMQDNLEFLQWSKRYWDQYFPGTEYDALARRKASGAPVSAAAPPSHAPMRGSTSTSSSAARRPAQQPSNTAAARAPRAATSSIVNGGAVSSALREENNTLKETVAGLERERDFYFEKLRNIEVLLQQEVEEKPQLADEGPEGLIGRLQVILYSTEEGFEIPEEVQGEAEGEDEEGVGAGEEETF